MNRTDVSCVKWEDFNDHMFSTFLDVYLNALYTDVNLVLADGGQLTASRMVLSMASKFFEDIFSTAFTAMPFCGGDGLQDVNIMIPDVNCGIMKNVLNFIYTGEVQMNAREMSDFFEACKLFQLKGLDYQNGNITGVKISGSNIITPVQFEYDDLHDTYVEGSSDGAGESEVSIIDAGTSLDVVEDTTFQQIDEAKNDLGTEQINQYYEVEIDLPELDTKSLPQTMIETKEEPKTDHIQTIPSDVDISMNESGESSGQSKKRAKNIEYGARLDEAINTIIQGGASFRTASIQYGIPKTVLWRKAVKAPNYKAERLELPSPRKEAIEALKSGEKLLNISKRFDIPLSTLHRDKLKLYSEGTLPENVSLKQRDKGLDFKQRVLEAAQQCLSGYMSQSEASKLYKLPKTTIWRRIKALRREVGSKDGATGEAGSTEIDMKSELIETLEDNDEDAEEEHLDSEYVVLV
ncbi:uncharacterized protein LOC131691154 [Topomyia yanbarensis]|uniref:uncharacterized protein LOC131691154 n=1 Tax=Topomyia yanbarensis TaxID=2498891 RepID=UPI00273BC5DF|nr:uncharacterized protein LOC131691154 [Topomyia yanbarensis]